MSDSQSSQSQSIKQRILDKLNKNPLLKAKDLCFLLNLPYTKYGDYINHVRSKWKSDIKFGLGSNCPSSQHQARAFVYTPKSCDRAAALNVGWELSKNRNRTLLWKRSLQFGRVEWFTSGKVLVYVRKPFQNLGKVKQILSDGFVETGLIFSKKLAVAFLDSVRWKGSHDVHETAERLSYKVIDNYVESHGIRIVLGDLSHPSAVEVQWCHPDWLERLELMAQYNIRTIEQFTKFMQDLAQPREPSSSAKGMVI
jgi:hypothetical protein